MKKLNLKKVSYVAIPLVCLISGFAIFAFISSSSSRILLKDQAKIDKIILHKQTGTHDCHCFTPHIASNPGFVISNITATSASFRWVCDTACTYQVGFGTTNNTADTFPKKRPTVMYADYTVTVTGLKANTTYHAQPIAYSQWCISNNHEAKTWIMEDRAQNDFTFKTLPQSAVLPENNVSHGDYLTTLSNVSAGKITTKEASIWWKTDFPSTSQIEYGTTKTYGSKSGENTELTMDHYIQLFGLQPGTTYYCRALSIASEGKAPLFSQDFSLTTEKIENRFANKDNYFIEPNPSSVRADFHYYLYQPVDNLTIDILTLSGKKVAVLESPSSALNNGWNRISWDLRDHSGKPLVNGLYVYIMKFTKGAATDVCKRSQLMIRR